MATNSLWEIAVAAAGVVFSLATINTNPLNAATITYDFSVDFFEGEEDVHGSFSYDDSIINPAQPFDVGLSDFLLNFRGDTLTKSNADAFEISFAQYALFEGAENCPEECGSDLIGIGVWNEWRFNFQVEYRGGGILSLESSDAVPGDFIAIGGVSHQQAEKPGEVTSVPESGAGVSLLGLGAVGLASAALRKSKAKSQKSFS